MFWTETAWAMGQAGQAGGAAGGGLDSMSSLLPIVMIFAIIYFLMIRPQQKRDQEHKAMLKALKPGDRVMTAGGIHGTLVEVNEDTVLLDIGNKIIITVARQSVGNLTAKGKGSKEERRSRRERKAAGASASDNPAKGESKEEFVGKSFDPDSIDSGNAPQNDAAQNGSPSENGDDQKKDDNRA